MQGVTPIDLSKQTMIDGVALLSQTPLLKRYNKLVDCPVNCVYRWAASQFCQPSAKRPFSMRTIEVPVSCNGFCVAVWVIEQDQ